MGGHLIIAGVHEGKNCVCADIEKMLNRSNLSGPAKIGIRGAFHTLGIPEVVCFGLTDSQIPPSNQAVILKK
jgi:hypothetical protein